MRINKYIEEQNQQLLQQEQGNKKEVRRGLWTISDLLRPITWGEFFGILLWSVHILGYVFILIFLIDIVRFYIFHRGTIIWSREPFALALGIIFIVGTNYYVIYKNKKNRRSRENQ